MTTVSNPIIQGQVAGFERGTAEALRTAINGDQATVDALVQQLRAADQRAVELVRATTASIRRNTSSWCERLGLLARPIQSVVDRWSRR